MIFTYIISPSGGIAPRGEFQLDPEQFRVKDGWSVFVSDEDFKQQVKHDNRLARLILGRDLTQGEVGAALAHQSIYAHHTMSSESWALVLEDDAVAVETNLSTQIQDAILYLESKPRTTTKGAVVLLGHTPSVWTSAGQLMTRQRIIPTGTFACLINQAASSVLFSNHVVDFVADWPVASMHVDFYAVSTPSVSLNSMAPSLVDQATTQFTRRWANSHREATWSRLKRVRNSQDLILLWHLMIKRGLALRFVYPWLRRVTRKDHHR